MGKNYLLAFVRTDHGLLEATGFLLFYRSTRSKIKKQQDGKEQL